MDQTQQPLPNGAKAFRLNQTALFLACLAVGLVTIIIGKIFISHFILFGVFCPLFCMAAYMYITLGLRKGEIAPSQVADNTYFLGFLFFLGSLAITLALVDKSHIEMATFINGFGVALVTTIAGLTARILILQHVQNLPQARERAQVTLVDAVSTFREEVTVSTQLLVAARTAAIASITSTVKSGNDTLTAIVEQTRSTMENAANHVRDEMQNINIPSDLLINELKPALDECTAAVKALNAVVKKQTGASTAAVESFGQVVTSSLSVGDKSQELINTLQMAITDLQSKIGVFNTANVAVKTFSEQLTEVAAALEQIRINAAGIDDLKLTEKVEALSAAVEATATAATSHAHGLAGTQSNITALDEAIDGLKGRLVEIAKEVQEARQNMESVQGDLASNLSKQAETLDGVNQVMAAIKHFVENQSSRSVNVAGEIVVSQELVHDLTEGTILPMHPVGDDVKN